MQIYTKKSEKSIIIIRLFAERREFSNYLPKIVHKYKFCCLPLSKKAAATVVVGLFVDKIGG